MSTEGQHNFDAFGKENTKVLTFTNAVDFLRDSVLFFCSHIDSCDPEKHYKVPAPRKKSQFSWNIICLMHYERQLNALYILSTIYASTTKCVCHNSCTLGDFTDL